MKVYRAVVEVYVEGEADLEDLKDALEEMVLLEIDEDFRAEWEGKFSVEGIEINWESLELIPRR